MITLKETCSRCGSVLQLFDVHRVPVDHGEVRLLCGSCFKLGQRYVELRSRGLSDRQAWRKLSRGKG
jgi:ribosomal protein S27AE